jgi:hypothetical protein
VNHYFPRWTYLPLLHHPFLQPSYSLIAFSAVKFLSYVEESRAYQKFQQEERRMSSPRSKQQADPQPTGSVKRIDNGLQHHVQPDHPNAASESCFNSLSDAEEHFEFSPDDITDDPHGGEELGMNDSKLSSDSFRSTSSASSVNNNNNNPFPRNTHLRQSFSSRNTSWSPRSHFNRRSLTSSSSNNNNCNNNQFKCISANGHARQMFASSNGTSPSSRRSSLSDEAISSNDPASLEDDVLDLTQKVSPSGIRHI